MSSARVTEETDDMPEDLAETGEPTLEALVEKFMKGQGWPEMDAKNIGELWDKQIKEQQARLRREAIHFRECFATPSGRIVLNCLLDATLRAVTWPVQAMQNSDMMLAHGCWREGQNAFMANIIEAIAFANNNSKVKPRSTT